MIKFSVQCFIFSFFVWIDESLNDRFKRFEWVSFPLQFSSFTFANLIFQKSRVVLPI